MSLFSLLAHYGTGDNETEKFFLIPLAFLQHTAFITRSLDACNGLVLSGCRWLHGVRSASAPESISLWTKHQPLLHICLVVFGFFFVVALWPNISALRCTCLFILNIIALNWKLIERMDYRSRHFSLFSLHFLNFGQFMKHYFPFGFFRYRNLTCGKWVLICKNHLW